MKPATYTQPASGQTREDWLNVLAARLAPWFEGLGHEVPKIRVSIGFTSRGMRSKAIGECWSDCCSKDKVHEIFIVPTIDDPMRIADILAHEMIHAVVGLDAKHGKKFKKVAKAIGLEGKMTATIAGPDFISRATPILEEIGPIPHAQLTGRSSEKPKQTTRLVKCECSGCGYTARTTRKWLEAGPPWCPTCMEPLEAEDAGDDEGEGE